MRLGFALLSPVLLWMKCPYGSRLLFTIILTLSLSPLMSVEVAVSSPPSAADGIVAQAEKDAEEAIDAIKPEQCKDGEDPMAILKNAEKVLKETRDLAYRQVGRCDQTNTELANIITQDLATWPAPENMQCIALESVAGSVNGKKANNLAFQICLTTANTCEKVRAKIVDCGKNAEMAIAKTKETSAKTQLELLVKNADGVAENCVKNTVVKSYIDKQGEIENMQVNALSLEARKRVNTEGKNVCGSLAEAWDNDYVKIGAGALGGAALGAGAMALLGGDDDKKDGDNETAPDDSDNDDSDDSTTDCDESSEDCDADDDGNGTADDDSTADACDSSSDVTNSECYAALSATCMKDQSTSYCGDFFQHYCPPAGASESEVEKAGESTQYCTAERSRRFCNSSGDVQSPACIWYGSLGNSCKNNTDNQTCVPTYESQSVLASGCQQYAGDPLCDAVLKGSFMVKYAQSGNSTTALGAGNGTSNTNNNLPNGVSSKGLAGQFYNGGSGRVIAGTGTPSSRTGTNGYNNYRATSLAAQYSDILPSNSPSLFQVSSQEISARCQLNQLRGCGALTGF